MALCSFVQFVYLSKVTVALKFINDLQENNLEEKLEDELTTL